MYQEKDNVKYICKCGRGLNSHENMNNTDKCICNVIPLNNKSDVSTFDCIVEMLYYHKKNSIQPFSVIYTNDNNEENNEENNVDEKSTSMCENNNSHIDTISNIVDRIWNINYDSNTKKC